jgi:hypothetical protein
MTSVDEMLKLFCMSNQLLEHDLDRIEREHSLDLGRGHTAGTWVVQVDVRRFTFERADRGRHSLPDVGPAGASVSP